jgi:hypothetical protein
MKADLIVYNGKIHTFNKETRKFLQWPLKTGKLSRLEMTDWQTSSQMKPQN